MPYESGDRVAGRYLIDHFIGRGATADVYAVRDHEIGTEMALKLLHASAASDPEAVVRFEREAAIQRSIDHRNVAKVYGTGVTERDEPFIALELLNGYCLRDVIEHVGRVGIVHASSYVWQALQGLAVAHDAGALHRDLKPANLMLEPSPGPVERVCVIDFGLAELAGEDRITKQGEVVGSLAYLAPERLRGGAATEQSDLYSLGTVLYELIVGRRPFCGDTDVALIRSMVDDPVEPPRRAAPHTRINEALEELILDVLEKDPGRRPSSARVMSDRLEQAAKEYAMSQTD